MEYEKSHIGGYVRVLKSGRYSHVNYEVGEIWKITGIEGQHALFVSKGDESTTFCIEKTSKMYGVECEFIGMTNPEEEPNYQIY